MKDNVVVSQLADDDWFYRLAAAAVVAGDYSKSDFSLVHYYILLVRRNHLDYMAVFGLQEMQEQLFYPRPNYEFPFH